MPCATVLPLTHPRVGVDRRHQKCSQLVSSWVFQMLTQHLFPVEPNSNLSANAAISISIAACCGCLEPSISIFNMLLLLKDCLAFYWLGS